jgi:uncharacterized membrane protein
VDLIIDSLIVLISYCYIWGITQRDVFTEPPHRLTQFIQQKANGKYIPLLNQYLLLPRNSKYEFAEFLKN